MDERPYPDGITWDEAWRQRQRADESDRRIAELEAERDEAIKELGKMGREYGAMIAAVERERDEREEAARFLHKNWGMWEAEDAIYEANARWPWLEVE